MPPLPLRIAILKCDTPIPAVYSKYGTYGDIFTTLLKAGADTLSYTGLSSTSGLELSAFDVVFAQEYPSLENIDGVLISGSKYNSYDNDPWTLKLVEFTKQVLAQRRVRIIGVCFGHQIVGRAMGAKVARSTSEKGWEVSVTAIDLTKRGQEIFGTTALALHQMHRDIVYTYPEGTEELAYTAECAVQGMYIKNRIITVQGHPEFTQDIMEEILKFRHKAGIFDDEYYTEAMERADKYQDGVVVAKAFLKFLLED
ncbi:class I glutamine amidotransferase-like protein [Calycina marina]|uniref:Class I glutamine amidotransferase-like protein n=1 Tax=Calycina marina TaxID=1763456 RepID=A0A9P8CHA6_9HELO|nr:class I glutamine amidotransferase-like protein [Calycina marina]